MSAGDLDRVILETLYDGVYMTDSDRRVSYWNRGAERITGFSAEEVVGSHCWDNILQHVDEKGRSLCRSQCALSRALTDGVPQEIEAFLHHKKGYRVPVRIRVSPLRDEGGAVVGAVEVFTDNFEARHVEQRIAELERLAYLDTLTGLANRRFAEIQLNIALSEFQRYGWTFGIVLLDVDRFKEINDLRGHPVGDLVLKTLAATLARSSRPFDTVARWGGDEFLAIVKHVTLEQLDQIAEKYENLAAASRPEGDPESVRISVSAGCTLVRESDTAPSLLARADERMYQRKNRLLIASHGPARGVGSR